ncbi:SMP-30/gluconolactonase/LRE family protein [Nocardia cyriacigeorgica]|uniref:SMP-30/gluconolactonase/LRE family protein n=1 Tax=Nocardia cyriacigeorgica TaxID=135487 RepID=UPI0018940772|nr:SMP-30/gluconolactonase/LRE family protein [Nocardia cyriacigeorgica]MBF6452934.1 superoxide dismutase [Nocardia cyriacigeorgica]MBF6478761.1 superoxide dismutase [Nocardia cyriacigeorgica]MBF6550103.1 superoxide dismutase [Nocardia cyriacigeorgica]
MSHASPRRWSAAVFAATATLALAGCGGTAESAEPAPRIETAFELPGDRVYPEGIAVDERNGDIYVGSFADGTIYRAAAGAERADVFLPSGTDGRVTANGLRVDSAGRLWVTDSTAGVSVYDIASRALLARLDVPGSGERFVNDIAITADGTAYLTDSKRAVLYRVSPADLNRVIAGGGRGELTVGFDLNPVIEPHGPEAYTLNGITADAAGSLLLVVDSAGGDLYRVDLGSDAGGAIGKVDLNGGEVSMGDGLELDGTTLRVAQNMKNTVVRWTLTADGTGAKREAEVSDPTLAVPTTLVHIDDRTLVVASQFDKGGPLGPGTPATPFRILSVTGI